MPGSIDFRHDRTHDVIIAIPHWKIETKADVEEWYRQYEEFMKPFGRRMDFIVVLDDFQIATAIGPYWGEYRAKVHQRFTRFNYRVHANNKVKLFVNTSGARFNVGTEEAATVEDALLGIEESRRLAAAG